MMSGNSYSLKICAECHISIRTQKQATYLDWNHYYLGICYSDKITLKCRQFYYAKKRFRRLVERTFFFLDTLFEINNPIGEIKG